MKKSTLISIFLIITVTFIAMIPGKSISRPAYALSDTDAFITENDYELLSDELNTDGTIEEYFAVWIKPSDCWPIGLPPPPPCTGAFGASYNSDSDKSQYDETYYDSIRLYSGLFPNYEEITNEVPGAGYAFVYTLITDVYIATAYFGVKTGVFAIVTEYTIVISQEPFNSDLHINAQYDKAGITAIMVAVGEKVADNLNLPGNGVFVTIGALISLSIVAIIIKFRKK